MTNRSVPVIVGHNAHAVTIPMIFYFGKKSCEVHIYGPGSRVYYEL